MVYRSSSLWLGTKQFYSTKLDYSSWTVGTSTFINFWNDKWCFTTSFQQILQGYLMVLAFRIQSLSFGQVVIGTFPCLYNKCLIGVQIWLFTLKSARTFFLEPGVPYGWGKLIWSSSIPPSKTLILQKNFHGRLPTDMHIHNKGLHICSMCTLCEKHEESIQHLFFECSNALHIQSWVQQILLTSHFYNKGDLFFY